MGDRIVCLVWALVSGVLAVLAFQRMRWAAVALVVSAGVVALFCLVGSLFSPPLVVPGVLAAATAACCCSRRRSAGWPVVRRSAHGMM